MDSGGFLPVDMAVISSLGDGLCRLVFGREIMSGRLFKISQASDALSRKATPTAFYLGPIIRYVGANAKSRVPHKSLTKAVVFFKPRLLLSKQSQAQQ